MRWFAFLWLLVLAPSAQAADADAEVDLELVLAVDVSRSMDFDEQRLQRDGYVQAFRHPDLIEAIASGPLGRIAVTYFEWAGTGFSSIIVPWMTVSGVEEADAFAALLAAAPVSRQNGTSISSGLAFAGRLLQDGPFSGTRRAVDVSGDGPNNEGAPVDAARDWLVEQGVTINGLPIMLKRVSFDFLSIPDLDRYYEDCVIGGPGAFMLTVDAESGFAEAIRRKLVLEIAGLPPQIVPVAEVIPEPVDCQIGEKQRRARGFNFNFQR
jgi:hypothetical protein